MTVNYLRHLLFISVTGKFPVSLKFHRKEIKLTLRANRGIVGCGCVVAIGRALPLLDKWLNEKCSLIPQNERNF